MPIGWRAIRDDIELTNGDFIASRTRPGGVPLPAGTTAEIKWATSPSPTTWAATIDGATVSWRVEAAGVAAIPAGTKFVMWIHYPNTVTGTTDDYEWVIGVARR
ncbi:LtfC-like domain-containing protein [Nocardia sp. CA-145437]|uniref:LtfC-like domain-containing protein n=1 Tax=Nocardia sp. CA-145437 TaxID=3239980 RepID=UPI003D986C6C